MNCKLLDLYLDLCQQKKWEPTWKGLREFKKNAREIRLSRR
jgi:hypothetical protein